MPSHFSDIGFAIASQDGVADLVMRAAQKGRRFRSTSGDYIYWSPGAGIELWVQTDRDGKIIDCSPHFAGTTRMRTEIAAILPDSGNPLDGSLKCSVNPESPEGGLWFILDLPNFELIRASLTSPAIATVQVAAFAHEMRCYRHERDFHEAQTGRLKFAVESFVAPGTFKPSQEALKPSNATAMVTGHVVAATVIINPATRERFHALQVHSVPGMMDVVADPAIVVGEPLSGGIVHGIFWLSGRILDVSGAGSRESIVLSQIQEQGRSQINGQRQRS